VGKSGSVLLVFAVFASGLLSAQTRETSYSPASNNPPQSDVSTSVSGSPYSRDASSTTMASARVALGPGDLLEITVFDTPELTQRIRVNSDGVITLPLVGEIKVLGMSPNELETLVQKRLVEGHFVKNPQVSVFTLEYAGQMAYVSGEVNHPGAYPLLRSHRLQNLITVAGGLSTRAGNIVTIRHGDSAETVNVDLSDKDETKSNPEIMPGDSVNVSQSGIVYVLGDVTRPGGFLLDRRTPLSVVQAVALAEGTKDSASLSKTRLIRMSGGIRQEIPLDLRMILKSKTQDPVLQAGDILFIPGSVTRGMGRRSIDTILATASGVAIYAYRP